jgi:hypothetical protein
MSFSKIFFVLLLGSVLLLSTVSASIGSADALKSKGTTNTSFGKDTSGIVCGDKLCSEIEKDEGRGPIYQQEAGPDPFTPTHSFNFNFEQDFIVFNGDNGYLQLQRNQDDSIRLQSNSTNTLDALTLSAWIMPDFSKSFGDYTIIGKENSFQLSVDNLNYPKKSAAFSVFDGITWTTVKSKSLLPEDWFHLTAVYEDDSVELYINGKSQGSVTIKAIRQVDSSGKTVNKVTDELASTGDLGIGTYITTSKSEGEKFRNKFSGKIDDIKVFTAALDAEKILLMYEENSLFYEDRFVNEQSLLDELVDSQ